MKIALTKNRCSGCSACFAICPKQAIAMLDDEEGFKYPTINEELCIKCGLCENVCPVLNIKNLNANIPTTYASWNNDENVRKNSSSGGIFSVLANYVLDNEGYVCGAAFENATYLKHIIISDKKELYRLRGSKYLQSDLSNVFNEIKELLKQNRYVLFCGTPCQVAGLNKFLNKKYIKLITVDIVCHGVPSPLVFKIYLDYLKKNYNGEIKEINFRDKINGWKNYNIIIKREFEGQSFVIKEQYRKNIFMKGFLSNLYLRPYCSVCNFKMPRQADITLGDFWGIAKHYPKLDDDKGTSLVIINSKNGNIVFEECKRNMKQCKQVDLKIGIAGNPCIVKSVKPHKNRNRFFNMLNNNYEDFESLVMKNIKESSVHKCSNIIRRIIRKGLKLIR